MPSMGEGSLSVKGSQSRGAAWSHRSSLVMVLVIALITPLVLWLSDRWNSNQWGPDVGEHLHGVAPLDDGVLLSGHAGTYVGGGGRSWMNIPVPGGFHPLGWAFGHQGALYGASSDGQLITMDAGRFSIRRIAAPAASIGALGAVEDAVFVASSTGEVLLSRDAGRSFVRRGPRQDLQGAISVKRRDPHVASALTDAGRGLETTDAGASWSVVAVRRGTELLIANPDNWDELALLAEGEAFRSLDHGRSWIPVDAPPDVASLAFGRDGRLLAATAFDGRGIVFQLVHGDWEAVV